MSGFVARPEPTASRTTSGPGNSRAAGSSASVAFAGPVALPTVPSAAVLKGDDGQPAVWVVDTSRAVRLRPVTLGPVQGDGVSITGGLDAGDWVVTAGVHDLRDGQPVSLP